MTVLWPLVPNWLSGLKETYEFRTEILTSRSGKEQRRALRTTPRRKFDYTSAATDDALHALEGLLARNQEKLVYGADFVRGVRTTSALPASANTVSLGSVPPWLIVGATVSLSHGRDTRLFTVASVSGATVTFGTPSPISFPTASLLARVIEGYVNADLATTRLTDSVATIDTTFEPNPATEPVDEGSLSPEHWFDGREVLTIRPNWSRAPSITYAHDIETVDYGRGRIARFSPVPFGTTTRQATYLARSVGEADAMRQFFARMKGRRGEFYMPSWTDDMTLAATTPALSGEMRIVGRQLFDDYADDTARRSILVSLKDGLTIALKFGAVTLDGTTSVLHLTETYPFDIDPADVKMISWMALSRFASDTLTVEWLTDGVAQFVVSVTSLEYADAEPTDLGEWDELTLYMLSTFGWDFTENVFCDPLQWAVNVRYPDIAEV